MALAETENRSWMLRVKRIVIIGLAMVGSLVFGAALWLSTSLFPPFGTTASPHLSADVEILTDTYGVPHIFAKNMRDAYFALGYIHAKDRMWQMEVTRRIGAGRLSEILGRSTLGMDRLMRTLGIYQQAEQSQELLSDDARAALEAYAAGVNHWIDGRAVSLAPELTALFHRPEPWRVADSLVWGKIMGLQLAKNMSDELLRADLTTILDEQQIKDLWPIQPGYSPTTITSGAPPTRPMIDDRDFHLEVWRADHGAQRFADTRLGFFGQQLGASNGWVISGRWTVSRKPILANDPHLGLTAPGTWYLARIETPEISLFGATAPGVPMVLFGQNGSVAWGFTSSEVDGEDLFIERLSEDKADHYDTPDGPAPFEAREETIGVRGSGDVTIRIRHTRHGVVISDSKGMPRRLAGDDRYVLALSSTVLGHFDRSAEALLRLNLAKNWPDFNEALALMSTPQLNALYADRDGNIGYLLTGQVPIRQAGKGEIPRPGWTGEYDWTGFIAESEKPRSYNPEHGFILSANNKIIDDGYDYFLAVDWPPPYRALRIGYLLGLTNLHSTSVESLTQNDIQSVMVSDLKPLMTDIAPTDPALKAIVGVLREWDGRMLARRSEPLIFTAWLQAFRLAVLADELGPHLAAFGNFKGYTVRNILTNRTEWCDDVTTAIITETCETQLELSLAQAIADLTERYGDNPLRWRWGSAHEITFNHNLGRTHPILSWLLTPRVVADGGPHTINKGTVIINRQTGASRSYGVGLRVIYDLADPNRSRFMIAPGQSGNPFSRNYDSLMEDWRDGLYLSMGLSRSALNRQGGPQIVLNASH